MNLEPPSSGTLTVTPEAIDASCSICKTGVRAPNKGLGRAVVAAWLTRHRHGTQN